MVLRGCILGCCMFSFLNSLCCVCLIVIFFLFQIFVHACALDQVKHLSLGFFPLLFQFSFSRINCRFFCLVGSIFVVADWSGPFMFA